MMPKIAPGPDISTPYSPAVTVIKRPRGGANQGDNHFASVLAEPPLHQDFATFRSRQDLRRHVDPASSVTMSCTHF